MHAHFSGSRKTNGRIAWLSIITTMYNYDMPLMLEIFVAYKDQSFDVVQMYVMAILRLELVPAGSTWLSNSVVLKRWWFDYFTQKHCSFDLYFALEQHKFSYELIVPVSIMLFFIFKILLIVSKAFIFLEGKYNKLPVCNSFICWCSVSTSLAPVLSHLALF